MRPEINRRQLLQNSAQFAGFSALAAAGLASQISNAENSNVCSSLAHSDSTRVRAASVNEFVPNRIACSTYSFWRFREDSKLTMPDCISMAADWGFDGIELLRIQMEETSDAYLQSIKRQCFLNGMDLVSISTHQGFVSPEMEVRQKNIDDTLGFIEMAYKLGIPVIRINTGRWGTTKNFDDLMANKGIEDRLEGFTDEEGFGWVIESIEKLLPTAEKCGVVLGLENHWGLGRDAEGVLRIIQAINNPWLKALLDTGNFFERQEEQYRLMAPHTAFVQAKTYFGGGTWYTLDIDYDQVAKILQEVNYRGYVSLEFEGKENFQTAIPKSLELLRKSFGKKHV
jgi:L-ribulose-5-phosphate 3-epimerase